MNENKGRYKVMITADLVNVLTLGVKNDGSEDISVIVNEATKEHALFFPKGVYRVSQPIYLKNSVKGEGYSRCILSAQDHTLLISDIENSDSQVGILNVEGAGSISIENMSLKCNTMECGLRFPDCTQDNMLFVDRVGIYDVRGYGIYEDGAVSRGMFLNNITIWGVKDHPVPGIGIYACTADNRFSNIEIMGCRIGMWLCKQFSYGSNLHLWTGDLTRKDDGTWWRGTRSLVLEQGAMFNVTNFYPDTSFYAIESLDSGCSCYINNLFYWEDDSVVGAPDFDGEFFKGPEGAVFKVFGGELFIPWKSENNGRMNSVYIPGSNNISGVLLKSDAPVCAENLKRLVLDDTLPDYTVEYAQPGWCKVAEIVAAQETGAVEGRLICDNGAVYEMKCYQKAPAAFTAQFNGSNLLCEEEAPLAVKKVNDTVYAVYFRKKDSMPESFRFITTVMQPKFRPLHFGVLKNTGKKSRCNECLKA
jgi:hypothetical protein